MPLTEDIVYKRRQFHIDPAALDALVTDAFLSSYSERVLYCGYSELTERLKKSPFVEEVNAEVNGFFLLNPLYGFEERQTVLTVGIRGSRFAPLLVWEVYHTLATGGLWMDIDDEQLCRGTYLIDKDFPERSYYKHCLSCLKEERIGNNLLRLYRKDKHSLIRNDVLNPGWTFGILTAGPSPTAARMAKDILEVCGEKSEIIICGPDPGGLPQDMRIRRIDLERPEPRGWISRKKNMIAEAAVYGNLCIMHDRFVFPHNFMEAMRRYGNVYSILTCPQFYFPESSRSFLQRYPDYQVLLQQKKLEDTFVHKIYHSDRVFHPRYDDFMETCFCCGGLYVAPRSLWQFVKQDESLFHCEWEDIHFGLECQRRGIPHRVNPFSSFESLNGHPHLLTRMHALGADGIRKRSFFHVTGVQQRLTRRHPTQFKPLVSRSREDYYGRVIHAFNSIDLGDVTQRMSMQDVEQCNGLFDFWREIYCRAVKLPLQRREQVLAVYSLLCSFVYSYPNCIVQTWIRETELSLVRSNSERARITAVKSILAQGARLLSEDLPIRERLLQVGRPFIMKLMARYLRIPLPAAGPSLKPFVSILLHFWEAERYYPQVFALSPPISSAPTLSATERSRAWKTFTNSPEARTLIFVQFKGEILPPVAT